MFYRLHSAVDVQKVESFKDLLTMEKEIVLGASISQLEEIEKPTLPSLSLRRGQSDRGKLRRPL